MYKILLLVVVLAFLSCREQRKKTEVTQIDSNTIGDYVEVEDTLRNPSSYYYLADKCPKQFAELILNDSIRPADNFSTFRVMDSLEAKLFEDRKFYLKVFVNIMDKSDGALAEAVGLPALTYVENHTKEFLELSSLLTKDQFEKWANFVGVEIFLSSGNNPKKDIEDYYSKLKTNIKGSSSEQKDKLEEFHAVMKKAIVDNEK